MCNAWNHMKNCRCGFGGEGYEGSGRVSWNVEWEQHLPTQAWHNNSSDFCWFTKCPVCHEDVYFVRHNGGSVWFDNLGKPWPKHAYFFKNLEVDPADIDAEKITADAWLSYIEWGISDLKHIRKHKNLSRLSLVSRKATLITDMTHGLYIDGVAASYDPEEINLFSEEKRGQFIEARIAEVKQRERKNFIDGSIHAAIENLRKGGYNQSQINQRLPTVTKAIETSKRAIELEQDVEQAIRSYYSQDSVLVADLAQGEANHLKAQNRIEEALTYENLSYRASCSADFENRFEQSYRVVVAYLNERGHAIIKQSFFGPTQKSSGKRKASVAYNAALEQFGAGDLATGIVYLVGMPDGLWTKYNGSQPLKNNLGVKMVYTRNEIFNFMFRNG